MKAKLIIVAILAALFVGVSWTSSPPASDPGILSSSGLHWHPRLEIYVRGEKQDIPSNIGVGPHYAGMPTFDPSMRMTAIHTHDPDGTIHLEFPAQVTRDDIKLNNFFTIWGKEMMSFGSVVTMTINGEENTELGEYEMKDRDKIVLRYE